MMGCGAKPQKPPLSAGVSLTVWHCGSVINEPRWPAAQDRPDRRPGKTAEK